MQLSPWNKKINSTVRTKFRLNIVCFAMIAWPCECFHLLPYSQAKGRAAKPFAEFSISSASTIAPQRYLRQTTTSSVLPNVNSNGSDANDPTMILPNQRRKVLATFAFPSIVATLTNLKVPPSVAAEEPSKEQVGKPKEFVNVGTQAPTPNDDTSPFITLENGVKIKDFRVGVDESIVNKGSRVDIQCSGRLLNLNGVVFYNTKNNNPDGFGAIPLVIEIGKGQAVPGLEAGLVGMKKGGIRRIIVPQDLAYNKFPGLEPKPMTANDQRALDSVVKNSRRDGAILFDVQLERVK